MYGRKCSDQHATLKKITDLPNTAQFCLVVCIKRIVAHTVHAYDPTGELQLVFLVEVYPEQNGEPWFNEKQYFWCNPQELSINTNGMHMLC